MSVQFIPEMINWYRQGKFPIDKMIKQYKVLILTAHSSWRISRRARACSADATFYQVEDFQTALHDMHTGETIKPVIVFS